MNWLGARLSLEPAALKLAIGLALLLVAVPASARPLTGDDLLTAAGLTPTATVNDAVKRYGAGVPLGGGGVEFLAKGSLSDAWLIFKPGKQVYVDCEEAPANLPDDAVGKLCRIAMGADWRAALVALQEALDEGQPRAVGSAGHFQPLPAPANTVHTGQGTDDADEGKEDEAFVDVSRTFRTSGYRVQVETCPRIGTDDNGYWRAAVLVTWTPD